MACSSSLPEKVLSGRQKVIDELVQGREMANQLQNLLFQSDDDDRSVVTSAEDLVSRIMASFTNTLSILNNRSNDTNEAVVSRILAATSSHVDSPACLDARKSEDSEESSKSVSTTLKDRRGCYKRKKTNCTQETKTSTLIDDGRAWRKYGQKRILNAKHPRNYFRCTHKYDQGCQATKQVQQIEDNPPMYRTTYYGHHTCRDPQSAPELVLDCTSPGQDSSVLVSFNNTNLKLTSKQAHPFLSSFTSVKQELKDDKMVPCNDRNNNMVIAPNMNQTSSSDYIVSPDHDQYDHHDQHHHHDQDDLTAAFDQSSGHNMTALSSNFDSDIHDDVMSMSFDDEVFQQMVF